MSKMIYNLDTIQESVLVQLGNQGENDATQLRFDISAWLAEWPEGVAQISYRLPDSTAVYPVTPSKVAVQDGILTWTIERSVTAVSGHGYAVIIWLQGDVERRSIRLSTLVRPGLPAAGPAPNPMEDWIADLQRAAADVISAGENAEVILASAVKKVSVNGVEVRPDAAGNVALPVNQPDGLAKLGADGLLSAAYIPGLLIKRYGVEIPAVSQTACTRLYDAAGMVANAHLGSYNPSLRNDFDDVFLMRGRERINYDALSGKVLAREGDGAFAVDGSNGDVVVRQIAHWRKREILPDGREIRAFADGAIAGYDYVPEVLIPCFLASAADAGSEGNNGSGTLRSIAGAVPLTSVSLANFAAKAQNGGAEIMDVDTWADIADMMLIEFADRNMQAKMGNGIASVAYNSTTRPLVSEAGANRVVVTAAQAAQITLYNTVIIGPTAQTNSGAKALYRPILAINSLPDSRAEIVFAGAPVDVLDTDYITITKNVTGQSEGILHGSGYIGVNGKAAARYRGQEDPYGHVFQGLTGLLKLGSHPPVYYYCKDPAKYAMSVTADYKEAGRCLIDAEGYIKTVLHDPSAPYATSLIGDEVGGSSSTFWADYIYRTPQGTEESGRLRVPFAGGYWLTGSLGGPWYVTWALAPSSAIWAYGARLLVRPPWGARGA